MPIGVFCEFCPSTVFSLAPNLLHPYLVGAAPGKIAVSPVSLDLEISGRTSQMVLTTFRPETLEKDGGWPTGIFKLET